MSNVVPFPARAAKPVMPEVPAELRRHLDVIATAWHLDRDQTDAVMSEAQQMLAAGCYSDREIRLHAKCVANALRCGRWAS